MCLSNNVMFFILQDYSLCQEETDIKNPLHLVFIHFGFVQFWFTAEDQCLLIRYCSALNTILLCVCKSECEFNLSPLYSAVIYHPSCWTQTQRKWSVSATGREEGGRSDPQHVNLDLFYESRPPCKMKCSCCERKQWSATHVITLTPWRGSTGIHPQAMAPMCPLGLKLHQPPSL